MQAHVLLFGLQDYAHKCRHKRLNPDIESDEVHMISPPQIRSTLFAHITAVTIVAHSQLVLASGR